jgi:hypothetical protein
MTVGLNEASREGAPRSEGANRQQTKATPIPLLPPIRVTAPRAPLAGPRAINIRPGNGACVRQRGGPSPTVCETPTNGTPMKRLLLATAFACIAGAMPAEAAQFWVDKGYGFEGFPTLYLEGDIEPGDFDKFAPLAAKLPPKSSVALNSNGGLIREALMIGFHSAYRGDTGQVSGGANALVGAYLSRLGFSTSAIYYMTKTDPGSMEWLTLEKARELGIKVLHASGDKGIASTEKPTGGQPLSPSAKTAIIPDQYVGLWCWIDNYVFRKCEASKKDRVAIDAKFVTPIVVSKKGDKPVKCELLEWWVKQEGKSVGRFECPEGVHQFSFVNKIDGKLSITWQAWKE